MADAPNDGIERRPARDTFEVRIRNTGVIEVHMTADDKPAVTVLRPGTLAHTVLEAALMEARLPHIETD